MKSIIVLCSISLLLGLLSSSSLPRVSANPSILYVGDGQPYPTIGSALAVAGEGDTILVSSGVYNETNLVITQNGLILQGADQTTTIIDGENSNKNITVVKANNVVIRGFTIRNAGTQYFAYGIYVYHANNTLLENNIFSGCSFSVRAQNSMNLTVRTSSFQGDSGYQGSAGVYAYASQTGVVTGNTFSGVHVGVYLISGSTGFWVGKNAFLSSIFLGVNVANSPRNWVVQNMFRDNNSSLELKQNNGVNNMVADNSFVNSQFAGIVIEAAQNNTIVHNDFINNTHQVYFIGSPLSNAWNMTNFAEGNYWSDYKGNDVDRDGLIDTPYTIASGNADSYPLIGPFTEFLVTYQAASYKVYAISNSTITAFSYDPVAKQFSFQVSDSEGSFGICRLVFPNPLISFPYTVYVNGVSQDISPSPIFNGTSVAIFFSYNHGNAPSNVIVVPEFPVWMIVALLLVLTLVAATLKKHKPNGIRRFV